MKTISKDLKEIEVKLLAILQRETSKENAFITIHWNTEGLASQILSHYINRCCIQETHLENNNILEYQRKQTTHRNDRCVRSNGVKSRTYEAISRKTSKSDS